jgi:hypothetical protein
MDLRWKDEESARKAIADLNLVTLRFPSEAWVLKGAEYKALPARGEDICNRCGRDQHGHCTRGMSYQEKSALKNRIEVNRAAEEGSRTPPEGA